MYFVQFHCLCSSGNLATLTHFRLYQSVQVSHSIMLSYVSGIWQQENSSVESNHIDDDIGDELWLPLLLTGSSIKLIPPPLFQVSETGIGCRNAAEVTWHAFNCFERDLICKSEYIIIHSACIIYGLLYQCIKLC